MAITESKNADAVTLGLGVLGLCALPAASPQTFTDVGYIKACTVSYSRELKDFESGGLLVKRLAFRDRFRANADFAEVSITNLNKIIPSTASGGNSIRFGGSRTINRYAVRFEHTRDDAAVITIDIYRAVASGEFALAFAEEEFIKYPVEYSAEADTTKTVGQQYGKIAIV
jgi:hypothetical protein